MDELDLVKFQISRKITGLAKVSLEIIEEKSNLIGKLQKVLLHMGFDQKELSSVTEDFIKQRKKILDCKCESERELFSFVDGFNIELKKEK